MSLLAGGRLPEVSAECEAPLDDSEANTMITPDVDVQSTVADVATAEDGLALEAVVNSVDADEPAPDSPKPRRVLGIAWGRVVAFGLMPAVAMMLAAAAGFLKWQDSSVRGSGTARIESVQAATDSTIKILSYRPDTVDRDLGAARDRLTGTFRDAYTSLTNEVVIPGSKQKQISAVAAVPAAASVSATRNHAVVLVFVNQTVIVGNDAPSSTASSVRVTLDKQGDRWLISGFDPV
jgi:Mce-associated membrane protein